MKMNKFIPVVALSAVVAFASSCSDDDNGGGDVTGEKLEVKTVTLSRKTDYGNDWIYYSFKEGKEVTVEESKHTTDLTWDVAFNRYNVRTNSGESGSGKGGALDTKKTDITLIETVPSGTFTEDEKGEITASFTGEGITTVESTLNKLLGEAIVFAGPPPTYTPNDHVYIVKTADGKYAKFTIESFYNDEGVSGFLTFKYAYQPDGSTNLK